MCKVTIVLFVLTIELTLAQRGAQHVIVEKACKNNDNIRAVFEFTGKRLEEANEYVLVVDYDFKQFFLVVLRFDTEDATVSVIDNTPATIISNPKDRQFHVIFTEPKEYLRLRIKGTPFGRVPYPTSIQVNSVEICDENLTGYIDEYATGIKTIPDESCGRRKMEHTELIVNGLDSKPGDWPWHAAIYELRDSKTNFICGGTLLSETFILTAAHCVTIKDIAVLPETRKVILGKHNLLGDDQASQERDVDEIIIHEEFKRKSLVNDIAFIKLKAGVVFTDYVQPACIWHTDSDKKLQQENINGTVVGWGYDETDSLSSTLKHISIPKQTETNCIKSNPLFFSRMLNGQKFCAGFGNGTSACNGDSGGGFLVFVPDKTRNKTSGAWYVRGIVSLTVRRSDAPICDPHQYVIFTDVAEYRGWLYSDKTNFKSPT